MKNSFSIRLLIITTVFMTACEAKEDTGKKTEKTEQNDSTAQVKSAGDEVMLTSDQYKVAAIELGKVEMRNLSSILKVNGTIDVPPQNVVSISAP